MADTFDTATRSRVMASIRSQDTKPELAVRKALHANGFRYTLHNKSLPGKPDIVLPKFRTIVFVHGCFWHHHLNCPYAYIPHNNKAYWVDKFSRNIARHVRNEAALIEDGWRVVTIWECQLEADISRLLKVLMRLRDRLQRHG